VVNNGFPVIELEDGIGAIERVTLSRPTSRRESFYMKVMNITSPPFRWRSFQSSKTVT